MKTRVAFFSFGVGDVTGGGGAERFFADLFDFYITSPLADHRLYWLIDAQSIVNLKSVGKLKQASKTKTFKVFSNRLKTQLENWQLLWFILTHRITLVHIPLYNLTYFPFLSFIKTLPTFIQPRLTVSIVDASLAYCYLDTQSPRYKEVNRNYSRLFKEISVDGYIAWNQSFVDLEKKHKVLTGSPLLYAIKSRFCDTTRFVPSLEKQNNVVFASRLTVFKNADWFIDAVEILNKRAPKKIVGWKFFVCGDGALRLPLLNTLKEKGLVDLITFLVEPRLELILNNAKCFVSCSDFDNFPSLSMAEAMAAGNVIVSRNVGQTELFVKDEKNGFLAKEDSPKGIADALERMIDESERFMELSLYSVKMMKEVHTVNNFIPQIDEFWRLTINK